MGPCKHKLNCVGTFCAHLSQKKYDQPGNICHQRIRKIVARTIGSATPQPN